MRSAPPKASLLDRLVSVKNSRPRALVLPLFVEFRPSRTAWDDLVLPLREEPVEVYGFFQALGPVPEALVQEAWSVLPYLDESAERMSEEGAVRTRRFMDDAEGRYDRITLFAHGPTMPVWTAGAIGTPASRKTDLVSLTGYDGFGDWKLHRRIRKTLGLQPDPPRKGGRSTWTASP